MKDEKTKRKSEKEEKIVRTITINPRGKSFEGIVIKKFPKRVVIEFERTIYVKKYERFAKGKTKLHARLPESFGESIKVGDLIKIRECRPLSKIIHFIVVEKIKDKENVK